MNNIIRSLPAKIIIYLMTCIMMMMAIASIGVGIVCYETGLYDKSPAEILEERAGLEAVSSAHIILGDVVDQLSDSGEVIEDSDYYYGGDEYEYSRYIADNYVYSITGADGKNIDKSQGFDENKVEYTYYLKEKSGEGDKYDASDIITEKDDVTERYITFKSYYEGNDGLPDTAECNIEKKSFGILYKYRNEALPTGVIALILLIVFFIMMLCVSARRPKSEELYPGYINKVPFDLILFVAMVGVGILGAICDQGWYDETILIFIGLFLIYTIFVFNGLCMDAAARIKEGTLIKNTIIYKVCKLCWKLFKKYVIGLIKWFFKKIRVFSSSIKEIIKNLPLIWKTVVGFGLISFIEIIVLGCTWYEMDNYVICWFIGHIILFIVICRFALGLRGLQVAGRALAAGDYEHRVDTSKLRFDFKEHGENLNHISDGMVMAVEEKMKSERMKTELITNVSHDIKTPLTSIINYADLIGKEKTENENIKEYTEVLLRQSERLKRLIEDLVEASKASTGNLEVELAPCEASMFITQIAGEYEEKFNNAGLKLVTKGFDNSAYIMADGRRMLRVFDNLMNNICKYALENSRVYLSLEVLEKTEDNTELAVITFKNTSRNELDMPPEELMERFVRGDKSRNTEGNGLGLSIARSMTELQGGEFDIKIDGDLFKVILTFPKIKQ